MSEEIPDDEPLTDDTLDTHARAWQEDGVTVVPGLLPQSAVGSALDQCRRLTPGPYEQAAPSRRRYDPAGDEGPAFRPGQFGATTLFAFPDAPDLNALVLHPELIRFARRALGTDDIRLYQARAWSKYAGEVNYEQPMHRDLNHSLVPTRSELGWWHLETFVYLHDVDESTAATRVVPRTTGMAEPDTPFPVAPDEAPALYAAERPANGPAGSVMAYRSDTWHRGVDLQPGAERHLLIVAFRPAGLEWIGFDPLAPLVINPDYLAAAAAWSVDQLTVMGIPRPGHPYWTDEMVDAFAVQYRGLDVEPWRAALRGR